MVGTTIFATVTSQLGLKAPGVIILPQSGWALLISFVLRFLLILAPVLTTMQTYLTGINATVLVGLLVAGFRIGFTSLFMASRPSGALIVTSHRAARYCSSNWRKVK
jgi:hypothetical protein